jgi:hypothetical protein
LGEARSLRDYQRAASEAGKVRGIGEAELRWSEESLASERKFGQRIARLYPLLGVENGVRTPEGIGTLLQAIGREARVLLMRTKPSEASRDLDGKPYRPMTSFPVEDVRPYQTRRNP